MKKAIITLFSTFPSDISYSVNLQKSLKVSALEDAELDGRVGKCIDFTELFCLKICFT